MKGTPKKEKKISLKKIFLMKVKAHTNYLNESIRKISREPTAG